MNQDNSNRFDTHVKKKTQISRATDKKENTQLPEIAHPTFGVLTKEFAIELSEILYEHNFYNHKGQVSTLSFNKELKIEELQVMHVQPFRTAIEDYCTPYKMIEDKPLAYTIGADLASMVLVSPQFIRGLRLITGLNYTRLPVMRENGTVELLSEGYDDSSHIFTISRGTAIYDQNMNHRDAKKFIRELLSEFCFTEADKEHSRTVIVAAMLTLYCRHLFTLETIRPNFLWNANAEGAGKTLGAKVAIIPTLGYCPTGSMPADEPEIRKNITTAVMAGTPVLFYDNVKKRIASGAIEALTTSPEYRDRILGGNREISGHHGLTLFITGNGCTFTPDFRRRTFIVDLFLAEARAEDRIIKHPLNDARLIELRPKILSAMWSLVKTWVEAGKPKPSVCHTGFVDWSRIINGILEHSGFMKLCESSLEASIGGDQDLLDMEKLVYLMKPKVQYLFENLEDIIKKNGLFQKLYKADNAALVEINLSSIRSRMGYILKRFDRRTVKTRRFDIQDDKNRSRKRFVVEEVVPSVDLTRLSNQEEV